MTKRPLVVTGLMVALIVAGKGIWALHLARHRYPGWNRGQFPEG